MILAFRILFFIPVKDEGEKTICVDAYETSQAEIASYTSIGTRKSQQDSICFDFGDFCTVCAVCDGMGGLTGGERASALAAHGVTRYLLEHAQAEDIPTEMGRAALRLNEEVKNLRDPANQKIEAGTTLTTVFLRNGKLFWCSIGDSHIYLYAFGRMFSGVYWNHEDSEVKKLEESHGAVVSKGNGVYTFSDGTTYETSTKDSYGFTSLGNFFNGFGDLFGILSRYM